MAWCCTAFGAEGAEEICVPPPRNGSGGSNGRAGKQRPPFPWSEEEVAPDAGARLKFWSAGCSKQHPDKSAWTNADAFIAGESILGIADGVSAVELEGYDPSLLPLELLRRCDELHRVRLVSPLRFGSEVKSRFDDFAELSIDEVRATWPKYLMAEAFLGCETLGATTALLVGIEPAEGEGATISATMPGANIGDSQLLHLRCENGTWSMLLKSNPQVHWFNCPYQLTRMPDTSMADESLFRQATCAETLCGTVLEGDILVVATDGVFDNLFDEQIVEVIAGANPGGALKVHPQELATLIVDRAIRNATVFEKETGMTPFSRLAQVSTGRTLYGGKPDDTTAAVAYVVRSDRPPEVANAADTSPPAPPGVAEADLPPTATPRGPAHQGSRFPGP